MGAPTWPPYPQTLVAPRMNRGAPRSRACRMGAPTWPPYPQRSPRPGEAVPRLDLALEARGAREMERAAVGVGEAEHGRMKTHAPQRIGLRPERAIADDRMSERGELGADLATPAGDQAQLEHGRPRAPLADARRELRREPALDGGRLGDYQEAVKRRLQAQFAARAVERELRLEPA